MNIHNIYRDVLGILANEQWQVLTIPSDFIKPEPLPKEWVRVSILVGPSTINKVSASGILMMEIFAEVGEGPMAYATIAANLRSIMAYKTFKNSDGDTMQLSDVTIGAPTVDKALPSFQQVKCSIPFNHYGVT